MPRRIRAPPPRRGPCRGDEARPASTRAGLLTLKHQTAGADRTRVTAVTCTLEELTSLECAMSEETVGGLDDDALTQLLLWRFRHFVNRGNSISEALLLAAGFTAPEAGAIAFRLSREPELVH